MLWENRTLDSHNSHSFRSGMGKLRPAEGLENAKKNEVSKNICANIINPSKMKAE
jgi:hypothetical protein